MTDSLPTGVTQVMLDMFCEQNKIRTDPESFIPDLEAIVTQFGVGHCGPDDYMMSDGVTCMQTQEGAAAYQEAIEFLQEADAVPALEWSMGIFWAAEDHCENNFSGGNNNFSHTGSDGSSPSERISRYGTWSLSGENLAWGPTEARDALLALFVDDGIPDRGHRDNIFAGGWEQAAVATCNAVSVWNFAAGFEHNSASQSDENYDWTYECPGAGGNGGNGGNGGDGGIPKGATAMTSFAAVVFAAISTLLF